jgi:hypothetical protein
MLIVAPISCGGAPDRGRAVLAEGVVVRRRAKALE